MTISKVTFDRAAGNLNAVAFGQDHISALVFDVPTFPVGAVDGDVFEFFSIEEAEAAGFKVYEKGGVGNYENGVPHYHISEFFRINPNARLFVAVADVVSAGNWNILDDVRSTSQGSVRQVGVYTRQALWTDGSPYVLNLVSDLQGKATAALTDNQPFSVLLTANGTNVTALVNTSLTDIPTCIGTSNDVTILLGQANSDSVQSMQSVNGSDKATVGCVGSALGMVALASVHESIGWVAQFNVSGAGFETIALGFGDTTAKGGAGDDSDYLVDNTPYESLSKAQLDVIEDNGYVFPVKYTGYDGTFFSSDRTCTNSTYRTISRNRVINKSRREVRNVLVPYLNSPVTIDPALGTLAPAQIKIYKNAVEGVLQAMFDAGEISGFNVRIDPAQNVLLNDTLNVTYVIVPIGTAKQIIVTEELKTTTA